MKLSSLLYSLLFAFDCKFLSCLQLLPPQPPWHKWWDLELWSKGTLSFWNRFPQNILSWKWSNGKKNQDSGFSWNNLNLLKEEVFFALVSIHATICACKTCWLELQVVLMASDAASSDITGYLISILEHLMQRFTVFKSLWNCENIKRCDREKKAAKEKKKKKMNISFTLVPSWDYSCLIHTIWGCLIRNYLE